MAILFVRIFIVVVVLAFIFVLKKIIEERNRNHPNDGRKNDY
jgi:flagellar biogenesis protein FliO